MESPLPDIPGQENGGGGTGQAREAAGTEVQIPTKSPADSEMMSPGVPK